VKKTDLAVLLLLGALWGGSFLFMRMGASAFGALPLAGLRAIGAALCLLPLLASRKHLTEWRTHWKPIAVVGLATRRCPSRCSPSPRTACRLDWLRSSMR
jgi:drug/metabolite transporter (DMT)-like permease